MPKSLPSEALKLWEKVYTDSQSGDCDQECAARKAWGALKRAGWKKSGDGWVQNSMVELSMRIEKASIDKNGEMTWKAVTSDVEEDSYGDNMSLELFKDFVNRIKAKQKPKEKYCSEFWQGGEPYVSLSHYSDANGKSALGISTSTYIDGHYLKARGKFFDTELGKAAYNSIVKDQTEVHPEGKVRVSIAFIDQSHKHKSDGSVFVRNGDEPCERCIEEEANGTAKGLIYLSGHLIHYALTRVPANKRTQMEVERSMITTRLEDAASIVGEELADEVEKTQLVGKSELVVKSESIQKMDEEDDEEEMKEDEKEDEEEEMKSMLSSVLKSVEELKGFMKPVEKTVHPLDEAFETLRSEYDRLLEGAENADDVLRSFQPSFDAFSGVVIEKIRSSVTVKSETSETSSVDKAELMKLFSEVVKPMVEQIGIIRTELSDLKSKSVAEDNRNRIPAPRGLQTQLVDPQVERSKLKSAYSISEIVQNTVR